MIKKGMVFWYQYHLEKYVAVVLDSIFDGEYFLILISEKTNVAVDYMELRVYTVAWFSKFDMISERRMHYISDVLIEDSFNGCAGGYFSNKKVVINNCGQTNTWRHKERQLMTNNRIKDMLKKQSYNGC